MSGATIVCICVALWFVFKVAPQGDEDPLL